MNEQVRKHIKSLIEKAATETDAREGMMRAQAAQTLAIIAGSEQH